MKTWFNIGLSVAFAAISLASCNDNDDYETIEYTDRVKIDSVKIVNDTMSVFGVQSIRTYSTYASKCKGFYGYDYIYADDFSRDITAYQYHTNGTCTQANYTAANQINFSPQKVGTYTLRFWNGDNSWITKTIVVE